VLFVLQERGVKANHLFSVILDPFPSSGFDPPVVAFGFNDENAPFAKENVIQLRGGVFGFQKKVVDQNGTGKFPLYVFLYDLLRTVTVMTDLLMPQFFFDMKDQQNQKGNGVYRKKDQKDQKGVGGH
jgi:hypothetical protein